MYKTMVFVINKIIDNDIAIPETRQNLSALSSRVYRFFQGSDNRVIFKPGKIFTHGGGDENPSSHVQSIPYMYTHKSMRNRRRPLLAL